MEYMDRIRHAAETVENAIGHAEIAVILGSGLGDYGNALENAREISYASIPGFPVSTVPGHAGKLIAGDLMGKRVMMMSGRFHSYEGYSMQDVTLPIRVMALLGVKKLIVTNAAGGVNTAFSAGCLMMITDYINLSGKNPLIGENLSAFGPRFPDVSRAYTPRLRELARTCAKEMGIALNEGVYCWMNGPCYETPAEIRMVRILGADAVGMSTVPETIVAAHSQMEVLGISCITNMAAGVLNQPINHEEVMEMGRRVKGDFARLLSAIIEKM